MMKKYTIAIDGGTTNTRAVLIDGNREFAAVEMSRTGVKDTAVDGHNGKLKEAARTCIHRLVENHLTGFDEVERVIASGMITSGSGLYEIPHVTAPAGVFELAGRMREVLIEDVCPIPILFIPGVKNCDDPLAMDHYRTMDMMRGEEVESIAVLESYPKGRPYLLVLPGSHMKLVAINEKGQISGCLTTLSGELLSAVTHHTVIADAVGNGFVEADAYDLSMVLEGSRAAAAAGFSHACFQARILNQFVEPDHRKIACFLLGAVLQNDIEVLKRAGRPWTDCDVPVIISGKFPLGKAFADLLREDGYYRDIREFYPDSKLPLSALGALIVADAGRGAHVRDTYV